MPSRIVSLHIETSIYCKQLTEDFVLAVGALVVVAALAGVAVEPVRAGAAVEAGAAGALVDLGLAARPLEAGRALAQERRRQGEARCAVAARLTEEQGDHSH